ncbi:hypothetical protein HCB17_14530 [Salinispora arenicola]|nr:hypothetical protein [Salinispora arenicola]NIL42259.1 hypothetical protein [Salinispora arenicola]
MNLPQRLRAPVTPYADKPDDYAHHREVTVTTASPDPSSARTLVTVR